MKSLASALATPAQKAARPEELALLGGFSSLLLVPVEELVVGAVLLDRHGLLAVHLLGGGPRRGGRAPGSRALLLGRAPGARRSHLRLLDLGLRATFAGRLAGGRGRFYPPGGVVALCF